MISKFAVLASCALLSFSASANVLYTWVETDASAGKSPSNAKFSLVFSDAAVTKGYASFFFNEFYDAAPGADLAELHFTLGSLISTDFLSASKFYPSTGSRYMFSGNFQFVDGGLLTGQMRFNNGDTEFEISSVGTVFTFDRIAADAPIDAYCQPWSQHCGGATGYFEESTRSEVPEPGSIALFLIGMLAATGIYRKRRT